MSSLYATAIKGGPPYIGKWPYKFQCPSGSFITKFNGRSGSQLDRIGIECSDGTILSDGGNGGNAFQIDSSGKGFQSIMSTGFNGGSEYQSFNGYGYTGDNGKWNADVYQYRCPLNQKMTGIDGSIESSLVKNLNVTCDYTPDYCVNNLESPYCKWLMPQLKMSSSAKDKASYHNILNQACSINMGDTCRNNQTDLDLSTVQGYCKTNGDDDFCSCFGPVPSYIPTEVSGLPQCWNNKCSVHGYKPSTLQTCPSITICQQDIITQGNDNLTSNVSIKQDCHPTQIVNNPSAPAIPPVSNGSILSSNYVLYFLAFVLLVVVIIMFWGDDDDDKPVSKLSNYTR
jgi:hypothetical protein